MADPQGEVIEHPHRPTDPNWKVLAAFETGEARVLEKHRNHLRTVVSDRLRDGWWLWLRGFASRAGTQQGYDNLGLSVRRASAVKAYLLGPECRAPESQISGCIGIGDQWSSGGPDDNDPDWRGVEVILTPQQVRQQDLPPVPPPPPRAIQRCVHIRLISVPQTHGGNEPGGGHFTWSDRARRSVADARHRLISTLREVPSNQRVISIQLGTTTYDTWTTSETWPWVVFTWGLGTSDRVYVTHRARIETIHHNLAHRLYVHPEKVLLAMEDNIFTNSGYGNTINEWLLGIYS